SIGGMNVSGSIDLENMQLLQDGVPVGAIEDLGEGKYSFIAENEYGKISGTFSLGDDGNGKIEEGASVELASGEKYTLEGTYDAKSGAVIITATAVEPENSSSVTPEASATPTLEDQDIKLSDGTIARITKDGQVQILNGENEVIKISQLQPEDAKRVQEALVNGEEINDLKLYDAKQQADGSYAVALGKDGKLQDASSAMTIGAQDKTTGDRAVSVYSAQTHKPNGEGWAYTVLDSLDYLSKFSADLAQMIVEQEKYEKNNAELGQGLATLLAFMDPRDVREAMSVLVNAYAREGSRNVSVHESFNNSALELAVGKMQLKNGPNGPVVTGHAGSILGWGKVAATNGSSKYAGQLETLDAFFNDPFVSDQDKWAMKELLDAGQESEKAVLKILKEYEEYNAKISKLADELGVGVDELQQHAKDVFTPDENGKLVLDEAKLEAVIYGDNPTSAQKKIIDRAYKTLSTVDFTAGDPPKFKLGQGVPAYKKAYNSVPENRRGVPFASFVREAKFESDLKAAGITPQTITLGEGEEARTITVGVDKDGNILLPPNTELSETELIDVEGKVRAELPEGEKTKTLTLVRQKTENGKVVLENGKPVYETLQVATVDGEIVLRPVPPAAEGILGTGETPAPEQAAARTQQIANYETFSKALEAYTKNKDNAISYVDLLLSEYSPEAVTKDFQDNAPGSGVWMSSDLQGGHGSTIINVNADKITMKERMQLEALLNSSGNFEVHYIKGNEVTIYDTLRYETRRPSFATAEREIKSTNPHDPRLAPVEAARKALSAAQSLSDQDSTKESKVAAAQRELTNQKNILAYNYWNEANTALDTAYQDLQNAEENYKNTLVDPNYQKAVLAG
ncbi:hypothetical protein NO1_2072, partial [Candidatus Termititenax aidoneus]